MRRLSRSASPSRRASRPSEGKERLISLKTSTPPSAPPPRSAEDVELETMTETSEELDPIVIDVWVELPQEDEVARRSRVFGEMGVTGGEVWVRHWLRLRCTVLELFTESQKQKGNLDLQNALVTVRAAELRAATAGSGAGYGVDLRTSEGALLQLRALDGAHRQQLLAAFAAVWGGSAATIVQNAQQSATPQGAAARAGARGGGHRRRAHRQREAAVLEAQARSTIYCSSRRRRCSGATSASSSRTRRRRRCATRGCRGRRRATRSGCRSSRRRSPNGRPSSWLRSASFGSRCTRSPTPRPTCARRRRAPSRRT